MESWTDKLTRYASIGYSKTKDVVNKGIEKVKDPEFQHSVKQGISNFATKAKEVIVSLF